MTYRAAWTTTDRSQDVEGRSLAATGEESPPWQGEREAMTYEAKDASVHGVKLGSGNVVPGRSPERPLESSCRTEPRWRCARRMSWKKHDGLTA